MAGIFVSAPVRLHAFGLEPGRKYAASFAFTADDGAGGFNLGHNDMVVKKDGTIVFENEWTDVSPQGKPGTVLMWVRKAGVTFNDPPEVAADGTVLQAEIHLP
jgi:ribosomal protein L24E